MADLFGDYNRRALLLLTDIERWRIAVLVAVALLLLALTYLDLATLSRARRTVLVGLRTLVLMLGLMLTLEPAIELRQVSVVPNRIHVLVDVSESQSLPSGQGATRLALAHDAIGAAESAAERSGEAHSFRVATFSGTVDATTFEHARQITASAEGATGSATHIVESLRAVLDDSSSQDIGGVVIISDGIDTGELRRRVPDGDTLDDETLRLVERIGAPIHTIATATPNSLNDVAIARVRHDEFAFVRNAVIVAADVRVHGIDASRVPVTLFRNSTPVQTHELLLEPGRSNYSVQFEFVPQLIGKEIYSVATPVQPGEAVDSNNQKFFVLNVIRDKIRALLVVGRPTWDVRFLRQLLRNNPNVDLVSFFILRTQEDVHRGAERELSLIPFPTAELFNEQLGSFDVVIMQNFNYAPYELAHYLPRIRDYVQEGGGLAMVGGDLSFQSGGYASTPVAEVLPVTLPTSFAAADIVDERPFRPNLTDAGLRHPITRLTHDAHGNRALWEWLPEMHGTNIVTGLTQDGVALATHPRLRAGDAPMPVIAVANVGQGRAMAVTFDSTWRWSFEGAGIGGVSAPYANFWNNAVRWLIRDPELELVDVVLPRDIAGVDEVVDGVIRVLGPDYQPATDVPIEYEVTLQPLDALGDDSATERIERIIQPPNTLGEFPFSIERGRPGAYRIYGSYEDDGGQRHTDYEVFLRVDDREELRELEPRPDLLAALSSASGGRHYGAGERVGPLPFREPRVEEVVRRHVVHLWSGPWVLIVLLCLLVVEWSLRRRWGPL